MNDIGKLSGSGGSCVCVKENGSYFIVKCVFIEHIIFCTTHRREGENLWGRGSKMMRNLFHKFYVRPPLAQVLASEVSVRKRIFNFTDSLQCSQYLNKYYI